MSVHNEEIRWVKESIDSILNQTYQDFEFIIVVDNPKIDISLKKFLEDVAIGDSRIRLLYNEKNIGLAMSLNRGISVAEGKYVARMDADDISLLDRFEKEIAYITNNCCDMVASNIIIIDELSNIINTSEDKPENPEKDLPYSNMICHPSVLIKKEVLEKLGAYRNFRRSQDYDLWLRMLTSGYSIRIINEPLLKYRVRTTSITTSGRLEQYYIHIYQKNLYAERLKTGKDSFSEENLKEYLLKKKITPRKKKKCIKSMTHLDRSKNFMKNKNPLFIFELLASFVIYPTIAINGIKNTLRKEKK